MNLSCLNCGVLWLWHFLRDVGPGPIHYSAFIILQEHKTDDTPVYNIRSFRVSCASMFSSRRHSWPVLLVNQEELGTWSRLHRVTCQMGQFFWFNISNKKRSILYKYGLGLSSIWKNMARLRHIILTEAEGRGQYNMS